jgi:hypothetical protein
MSTAKVIFSFQSDDGNRWSIEASFETFHMEVGHTHTYTFWNKYVCVKLETCRRLETTRLNWWGLKYTWPIVTKKWIAKLQTYSSS